MDNDENFAYHRPVWDDNGRFYYEITTQKKEKNYVDALMFTARSVVKIVQQMSAP